MVSSAVLARLLAGALMAVALLIGPPVRAADVSHPDLRRIETYLNNVTSMQAKFVQIASNGNQASGAFYLSRPGKMRLEYDPPVPVVIIADGTWMIYHDRELDQVSYVPLGSTPADLLTRPNIRLSGVDLAVTDFRTDAGVIQVTLVQSDDRDAGKVTLYFTDEPLQLRKWTVVDAQGTEVQVTLVAPVFDVQLNEELFHFDNPKFNPNKAEQR